MSDDDDDENGSSNPVSANAITPDAKRKAEIRILKILKTPPISEQSQIYKDAYSNSYIKGYVETYPEAYDKGYENFRAKSNPSVEKLEEEVKNVEGDQEQKLSGTRDPTSPDDTPASPDTPSEGGSRRSKSRKRIPRKKKPTNFIKYAKKITKGL